MNKDKKIAVIGVSQDEKKFGHKIFIDLKEAGYHVWAVGIKGGIVKGERIYKNLADLKEKPDLVITVVAPAITETIVEECIKLGIKEIWMQPGSQSEEGAKRARSKSIKVTDTECFMTQEKLWTSCSLQF
jgi:predicted CoA-binding protein